MSEEFQDNGRNDENTMRILVATDIHLGYKEKDPERGDDSFLSFEEILKHAQHLKVDFLLLGGDLFHETRPSTSCLHRCTTLIRKYCLGDRAIRIQFLSDQNLNFSHLSSPCVNYEDPNLNVAVPIFSIHGNHDDPTGASNLSALDILADNGLVNYFGKYQHLNDLVVYPLLIRKGRTKLALYGLSHIRDERLYRKFDNREVKMPRPQGDYFNVMVLHQNRVPRGPKNFIPENFLPNFLDLVIWGHEHDCIIEPTQTVNGVFVSQPGSSVATSLSEGEAIPKHIGLLSINGDKFKMQKILLKTVRPFVYNVYNFKDSVDVDEEETNEESMKKAKALIEEMLEEAKEQIHNDEPNQKKLPLIRLNYNIFNESHQFNGIRMGQMFTGKVANPDDMIVVKYRKMQVKRERKGDFTGDDDAAIEEKPFCDQVIDLMQQYMQQNNRKDLSVLSMKAICEATTRFLEKGDEDAFEFVIKHQQEKAMEKLIQKDIDLTSVSLDKDFDHLLLELRQNPTQEDAELRKMKEMLDDTNRVRRVAENDDEVQIQDDSDDDMNNVTTASSSASRPARGRGSRGPRRSRARGRWS